MWAIDQLADCAAGALEAAERRAIEEQAVSGIDALDEVDLHPILAEGFLDRGYGAFREWPFPSGSKRRPQHRERERCDLVLTPSPSLRPFDPVEELLEQDKGEGTLFEQIQITDSGPARLQAEEACWIEVKATGQYTCAGGVAGANRTYTSDVLTAPLGDIRKLARDPLIEHGVMLFVLFTEDEATAAHDLSVLLHRCLDRGLPVADPVTRRFSVRDTIGNTAGSLTMMRVRGQGRH